MKNLWKKYKAWIEWQKQPAPNYLGGLRQDKTTEKETDNDKESEIV